MTDAVVPASAPPAPPPPAAPEAVAPSAPPVERPRAAEARARIDAIYADKTHAYHAGDPRATRMVNELFRTIHGDAPVPDGPQLGPDPNAVLRGPEEDAVLRDIGAGFAAAGMPRDYGQGIIDVVLGARATLSAAPPEYLPPSAAMTRAALIAAEGPARAAETIAKAEAVYEALTRISPEVADRLAYALGESGAGRLAATVRQFARFHDLAPESQQQLVRAYFGPRAVDTLFGAAPRR